MGWLLRGIGDFGGQVGEGHDIALDQQQRRQKMALDAARAQLDQQMLPLQMEELKARIRKLGMPEQKFITDPQGGTNEVDLNPDGTISAPKNIIPGSPKSLKQRFEEETDPEKKKALGKELKDETEATSHRTPMQDAQDDLMRAQASGDQVAIKAAEDKLRQLAGASKAEGAPTYWKLRMGALRGDPDAIAALKADDDMQKARLMARGLAFGQGRLYQMRTYINGQGQSEDLTGFEYERRKAAGENLTPTGRLSENTAVAYQRFRSEAYPALAAVEKDLPAFDNASDRAIFAKVMKGAGEPAHGSEMPWMQNILRQALASGLSDQGRALTIELSRLAETMGTLRASLALPSTEASMMMTLALLPGPGTPDQAYARQQLTQLKSIVDQAANVPLMQNVSPKPPAQNGPPPGSRIITLEQLGIK